MNFDAEVNNQIFRKDYQQILAINAHLATILGARVAYRAGGYNAGQVLASNGATPPVFSAYSAVSGSQNAAAILLDQIVDDGTVASTGTWLSRGVFGGEVYQTQLTDYN